jgi:hypothetical protein
MENSLTKVLALGYNVSNTLYLLSFIIVSICKISEVLNENNTISNFALETKEAYLVQARRNFPHH